MQAETRHVSLSVDRSVPGVLTYQEQQHHLHICTHRILEGRSCVHGVVGDHGMTMPPTYYCTTIPQSDQNKWKRRKDRESFCDLLISRVHRVGM